MNRDLGCVQIVKVPEANLETTSYTNGILFTWSSGLGGSGCWSALGVAPGFTNGLGNIVDLGAPAGWQIIGLDDVGCAGNKSRVENS